MICDVFSDCQSCLSSSFFRLGRQIAFIITSTVYVTYILKKRKVYFSKEVSDKCLGKNRCKCQERLPRDNDSANFSRVKTARKRSKMQESKSKRPASCTPFRRSSVPRPTKSHWQATSLEGLSTDDHSRHRIITLVFELCLFLSIKNLLIKPSKFDCVFY